MTTAHEVKKLVLDLPRVNRPTAAMIQQLREIVCDGWQYGFKDGSQLSDVQHDKMQAYINEVARRVLKAA